MQCNPTSNYSLFSIMGMFLLSLLYMGNIQAQDTATIYGTVRDNSNATIPDAIISVVGTTIHIQSNKDGQYSIEVPANTDLIIQASFTNYAPFKRSFNLKQGENKKINIRLLISELLEVDIIKKRKERIDNMDPIDTRLASVIPSPRTGIEGLIISQIGVKSNNELSSGYSVRGGNFDENLVYVNDIEVYRPFLARSGQQEGLSFPNPSLTASILFSAGGFDAKYGDKMSSVLDIKYKRPIENEGSLLLSMLGGSVHFGSAGFGGRLRQITGIRYKTNQYLFGALETQGDYKPRFADLQTYWNYSITDAWTVSFLGNYANNQYQFRPQSRQTNFGSINQALRLSVFFEGQEKTAYETFFGAMNLEYVKKKLVLKLITSGFETNEEENIDILGRYRIDELERDLGSDEFGEAVNNIGIGAYLNHARNKINANVFSAEHKGYYNANNHQWKWGLKFQKELISDVLNEWEYIDSAGYSVPTGNDLEIVLNNRRKAKSDLNSDRITTFLQDSRKWKFANNSEFIVTAGVRGTHWTYNNESLLSPRGRLSYAPDWKKVINDSTIISRDVIFRLSGGYYYQQPFYREMRNIEGVVNPNIKAQQSIHFMAGADMIIQMWGRPFKIISEAYYKSYDQLIPYKIEGVRLRYFATNNAKGYAQGIDFKINGEFVKGVESWATVSYLKTEEDLIDDFYDLSINTDGETIIPGLTANQDVAYTVRKYPGFIPRPTDQRISFSLFFQDELPMNPSYKVQLSLNFNSGLPFGPPGNDRYKDVNRTKPYQRVDIGFTKELFTKVKKREDGSVVRKSRFKEAWIALEVFNLLNINNSESFTWFRATNGNQYSVPNNLTSRLLNVKFFTRF